MTTLKQLFFEAVATCTTALLKANNEVTMDALKSEMRSNFPQLHSTTENLTEVLDGNEIRTVVPNLLSVSKGDTKTYYVMARKTQTGSNTATVTQPKQTNQTVKMSRTKIVQEMQNSKGRFMTVSWNRKNGTEAVYNGRVRKDKFMDALGYILLHPANPNDSVRKVTPNTINWVSLNGINFYPTR